MGCFPGPARIRLRRHAGQTHQPDGNQACQGCRRTGFAGLLAAPP